MTWYNIAILVPLMAGLAALPSSSVLLVVTQSTVRGIRNGLATAAGVVCGDLIFMMIAILGMSALAAQMGGFFVAVKYIAAAYLIWFGIGLLGSRPSGDRGTEATGGRVSSGGLIASFASGLLLTLGDIKAIFFYASLLPTFVDLEGLSGADIAIISAVTVLSVGGVKCAYAVGAEHVARKASGFKHASAVRRGTGGLMVGLGGYLLVKD
ncbi:LysE family translocator [Halovulum sp. GXIMD14794]